MMARYQEIARRLAPAIVPTLIGVTIFLLSGCQDLGPVPDKVSTKVPKPVLTQVNGFSIPEPNFAFTLEWDTCYSYIFNTFNNKLTLMTNVLNPPITATVDIVLSRQELGRISQKMRSIDFFGYPDEFSIQLPSDVMREYGIATRYLFDVRSGSQSKVVRWNDEFSEPTDMPWKDEYSEPSKTKAARLRELIKLIQQIVEAHPEYNKLPGPGGCA